jgi:murein DD-endopeptidase MepM/ murein hydrolase activator NlpD
MAQFGWHLPLPTAVSVIESSRLHPHFRLPTAAQFWRPVRLAAAGLCIGLIIPVSAAVASVKLSEHRSVLDIPAVQKLVAPKQILIWQGQDVDGDGAADFANPTGQAPRAHDDFGDGEFGAVRDGGARHHEGVDYAGTPGQAVTAPLSGYVTKIGWAYDDDHHLKFVEITNPALGYQTRVFYVEPDVEVGDVVAVGQNIGVLDSLQARYPGIINHVHLEMMERGKRFDAGTVIQARWVNEKSGQA